MDDDANFHVVALWSPDSMDITQALSQEIAGFLTRHDANRALGPQEIA